MSSRKAKPEVEKAAEQLVYCGPNFPNGQLLQFTVFRGGVPDYLSPHIEKCPAIRRLLVPVEDLTKTVVAIGKGGTAESVWFNQVENYLKGGGK